MTTDWRALCAEAFNLFDGYDKGERVDWDDWKDRARAALAEADGPAVPEGREPVSVAVEPSDDELHALADQFWVEETAPFEEEHYAFARAVLARWGDQPAPPAEGEVER